MKKQLTIRVLSDERKTSDGDKAAVIGSPNFRPILFSTAMVQALLTGRKTQTRRVAKLQPDGLHLQIDNACRDWNHIFKGYPKNVDIDIWNFGKCPYGEIGDILWVRETMIKNDGFTYWPVADGYKRNTHLDKTIPSIYMPKTACRLFLKIVAVRLELLQSISERDARNEGVAEVPSNDDLPSYLFKAYDSKKGYALSARASFESLWNSINGIESWPQNPWVWVIEFERIDLPTGFL